MTEIKDGTTIAAAFAAAVATHARRPFLAVPANEGRAYLQAGFEISYGEAGQADRGARRALPAAGYGVGHRVATCWRIGPSMSCTSLPSTASASAVCR